MQVIQLVVAVAMQIHLIACTWFLFGVIERFGETTWLPSEQVRAESGKGRWRAPTSKGRAICGAQQSPSISRMTPQLQRPLMFAHLSNLSLAVGTRRVHREAIHRVYLSGASHLRISRVIRSGAAGFSSAPPLQL